MVAVIEDDAGNSGGDVVEVGELALRAMQGAAVRVLQVGRTAARAVAEGVQRVGHGLGRGL